MIRRNADRLETRTDHFKGGAGYSIMKQILTGPEEMGGKGRVFSHGRLDKGCEVGWHVHTGDSEVFYILSGEGEFNDNGTVGTVYPGDVLITPDGTGHSMRNLKDEPLEFVALVLYT